MNRVLHKLHEAMSRLYRNDEGATAVEYAVLAASIAAVIVATVTDLGLHVQKLFSMVHDLMEAYL